MANLAQAVSRDVTSHKRGMLAEQRARQMLENKNYRVIVQRFRRRSGEIDIVARRGDHLAFVEVKQRKSHEEALWSVEPRQQARVALTAEVFLSENLDLAACTSSFDVITVNSAGACRHLEQAFLAS